jgi:GNAT superfamily N-acetyltransferase
MGYKIKDKFLGCMNTQCNGILNVVDTESNENIGYLQYTEDRLGNKKNPSIDMIKIKKPYRKKGLGKKLVRKLQKKYPKEEISWGMTSQSGLNLKKSMKNELYIDTNIRSKRKKLRKKIKSLYEQDKQLDNDMRTILSDKIGDEEREYLDKLQLKQDKINDTIRELEIEELRLK